MKKYNEIKTKGLISISRPQYCDGKEAISITIVDKASHEQFLDVEIPLAAFAAALTGLSRQDCDITARSLDVIGLTRETDMITFEISQDIRYSRNKLEEVLKLAEEATPEGWIAPSYFGSQDSYFMDEGKYYARGRISRFV